MRKIVRILSLGVITALILGSIVHASTLAVLEYDCNPSASGWTVVGAWDDGTVMERRVCLRVDTTADDVSAFSWWRTRKGGSPVQSYWELSSAISWVYSVTTGQQYGYRDNYGDVSSASYITISSYWGCSGTGGTQDYNGNILDVLANPIGSLPPSSYKSGSSFLAHDNFIDCTP